MRIVLKICGKKSLPTPAVLSLGSSYKNIQILTIPMTFELKVDTKWCLPLLNMPFFSFMHDEDEILLSLKVSNDGDDDDSIFDEKKIWILNLRFLYHFHNTNLFMFSSVGLCYSIHDSFIHFFFSCIYLSSPLRCALLRKMSVFCHCHSSFFRTSERFMGIVYFERIWKELKFARDEDVVWVRKKII